MILSRLDQTGMTTNTLDLAEALNKNHEVVVLIGFNNKTAIQTEKILLKKFNETGVKIKTFQIPKRDSKISKLLSGIDLILKILFTKNHVIHIQSPYLSWAPHILKKKFVSTMHVTDIWPSKYYKNADQLIAISKETKAHAINNLNYKPENITIVHHGVSQRFINNFNKEEIRKLRNELGVPSDKIIITLVGSIEPRKGHDILLRAVHNLPKEEQNRLHIIFLGSDKSQDGHNTKWLNEIISKTNLKSKISKFEYQSSEKFYKISDIFILPSWQEGFPLVTIEAMLAGCLCIRSDAEGAHEQIINNETGFIFSKGDIDGLTKILSKVLNDDNLRVCISKKGHAFALNHFLSSIMAQNTMEVYKKLIN